MFEEVRKPAAGEKFGVFLRKFEEILLRKSEGKSTRPVFFYYFFAYRKFSKISALRAEYIVLHFLNYCTGGEARINGFRSLLAPLGAPENCTPFVVSSALFPFILERFEPPNYDFTAIISF